MAGRVNQSDQTEAITKVLAVAPHAESIRAHVRDIVGSPTFRGSRRSQQFLQFVIDNALDGHFEELKERPLGARLFGRAADYNTNDDAIVRVTASDVRKRLYHFYTEGDFPSEYRIDLPLGSYIPEISQSPAKEPEIATEPDPPRLIALDTEPPLDPPRQVASANKGGRPGVRAALWLAAIVAACSGAWLAYHSRAGEPALPWSALMQSGRELQVVFCDPELVPIQRLAEASVTLSDYANGRYWPAASNRPDVRALVDSVGFRGVSVAAVDAATTVRIASLGTRPIATHPARSMRMADFQTDNGFVLFGSPRSNPWVELFQNQLDFRFEFDASRKSEFIRNVRPSKGEAAAYVPTAGGWATGNAYAIVALVSNPNQKGQVLILAGSNAEATEAAGRFCTDKSAIARTLAANGIDSRSNQHFEVLLRVATMAGSPNSVDVVACHALKPKA